MLRRSIIATACVSLVAEVAFATLCYAEHWAFVASKPQALTQVCLSNEFKLSKDTFTYKIVGDLEIKADVYRLLDQEIKPAIMYIHGGALMMGSRVGMPAEGQLERYLKAGYNVVSIDYRLAPETKLADIIEDIEDAYAWMRANGLGLLNIDPDRIAVMGMSAGGYLTLVAGYRLNPRPKALVSFYGYGDITGTWYSQPSPFYNQRPEVPKDEAFQYVGGLEISESPKGAAGQGRGVFYLYCRQQGLWPKEVSGHDPETERAWFSDYEPRSNVTAAYPPTMLLHGEKDTDVPFEQSVSMAELLKANNVDYELISRPDWGHGFDFREKEDPAVNSAIESVVAFLKKHVPSRPDSPDLRDGVLGSRSSHTQ